MQRLSVAPARHYVTPALLSVASARLFVTPARLPVAPTRLCETPARPSMTPARLFVAQARIFVAPAGIFVSSYRFMSTICRNVKMTEISKCLSLREIYPVQQDQTYQRRIVERNEGLFNGKLPLVILYQWIAANPSAVEKYCELYHSRGLDVLIVKAKAIHVLQTERGVNLAKEVLQYLKFKQQTEITSSFVGKRYIIHAFCIGAYLHTLCIKLSHENPETYGWFRNHICANVYDSIVIGNLCNMAANGLAVSVSNIALIQSATRTMARLYFRLREEKTAKFFSDNVSHFKTVPVRVPTQFFFSYNDPVCDSDALDELIKTWRHKFPDIAVSIKSWSVSAHAAHMKFHEADYKMTIHEFLSRLGL